MEPKPRVYLETTIPSYLTARTTRDLVRAAEQQLTREWWDGRHRFALVISQLVLDEAAAGDPDAATRRLAALADLALLDTSPRAVALGRRLLDGGGLPAKAAADALHIAIAATHGVEYLLTWNCAHIANARIRPLVEELCRSAGFQPPVICTPSELLED